MGTTDLLPCPFCAGEARLFSVSFPLRADCADIQVSCEDCDTIGPAVLFDQTEHREDDVAALEAEAIAAWNRRTTPAPAGELEEMRHTAMLDRAASQEHAAAYRESQALVHELRMALHMIDVEASNTIPPDGKDAAFAALGRIIRIINPFRTHPGATTKDRP